MLSQPRLGAEMERQIARTLACSDRRVRDTREACPWRGRWATEDPNGQDKVQTNDTPLSDAKHRVSVPDARRRPWLPVGTSGAARAAPFFEERVRERPLRLLRKPTSLAKRQWRRPKVSLSPTQGGTETKTCARTATLPRHKKALDRALHERLSPTLNRRKTTPPGGSHAW